MFAFGVGALLRSVRIVGMVCGALLLTGCDWLPNGEQSGRDAHGGYGIYRIIVFGVGVDDKGKVSPRISSGTGFLINDKNIIATNRHVVTVNGKPWPGIKVIYINKDKFELVDATVVGSMTSGQFEDLAFLRPVRTLPGRPVQIADYKPNVSGQVKAVGYPGAADIELERRLKEEILKDNALLSARTDEARVIALITAYLGGLEKAYRGNPDVFAATQTQGVVSKLAPYQNVPVVQHQAPINPGNSGGPLFDACDNVVGINTAFPGDSQGIFLALGSDFIAERAKAASFDVRTSNRCVSSLVRDYTGTSPVVLALITGMFLTTLTMLFFLRRTPVVQRGLTILSRRAPVPASGQGKPRVVAAGTVVAPAAGSPALKTVLEHQGLGTVVQGSAGAAAPVVRLVPVAGGQPIVLSGDRLGRGASIGREAGNDVVLDEKTVSKRHARLTLERGRLVAEDLKSANGTWKAGSKISRESFGAGEVIKFGSVQYRVELPSGAGVPAPGGGVAATMVEAPLAAERSLFLSGMDDDGRPVQFNLKSGVERSWRIGRKDGAVDLLIKNRSVSSQHGVIRFRPGFGFEISDTGSANGTLVDGTQVSSAFVSLERAKKIELGAFVLTVNRG